MKTEFDYTMMSTFLTCQRKYDFRHNRGLVGWEAMVAPDFGKAMHAALDVWYKHFSKKAVVADALDEVLTVFQANFQESPEDDKRTYKMADWILRNYTEKYVDQPFKVLATEQEFTLPLPNGNKLIGRIDKVIEWDGAIWGMDHKTTSMLGDSYMKMHTPNMQFSGYTWAIQQLGFPKCQGILVDAILVAKGLLEGKSGKSLVALRRDFAYRSTADVNEYLKVAQDIQVDIQLCTDAAIWTPNWDACTDYGECPYRRVCKEPVEFREAIIQSAFKVEPWDPRGAPKEVLK